MSTVSANATALPAFYPSVLSPTPRRGFLAGLASLPLLGGSVSFIGKPEPASKPEPESNPEADELATLDDYAVVSFDALDVDHDAAREAHRNMWTPLAIALRLMTKSPEQCRDFAASIGGPDDGEAADALFETLRDGAAWYRQAADIMDSAQCRHLCGAARLIKEGGADA